VVTLLRPWELCLQASVGPALSLNGAGIAPLLFRRFFVMRRISSRRLCRSSADIIGPRPQVSSGPDNQTYKVSRRTYQHEVVPGATAALCLGWLIVKDAIPNRFSIGATGGPVV
jgi:hypothetical protein